MSVMLVWTGCSKSSGKRRDSEAAAPPPSATQPAEQTAPQGGAGEQPALDQGQVRALVDTWVAAQNQGRFAEYAAFYAPGFRGVRRSGDKRVELDHDGWLAERKRMFKKAMSVSTANLRINIDGRRATVAFEQTWESGSYADSGPKRMEVELIDGRVLITSEEMLSSTRVAASNAPLLAMYPDAGDRPKLEDMTCEPVDEDSALLICLVVTEREGPSVSVDVGLLREKGPRYEVLDTYSTDYSVNSVLGPMYRGDDDLGLSESASASLGAKVEIGPKKFAFEVDFTARSSIQEEAGTTHMGEATVLIAVVGKALVEALRVESTKSGDTDFDGESTQRYEVLTSRSNGFYDVRVTTEKVSHQWPVDEHDTESDSERMTWQPGQGYQ